MQNTSSTKVFINRLQFLESSCRSSILSFFPLSVQGLMKDQALSLSIGFIGSVAAAI